MSNLGILFFSMGVMPESLQKSYDHTSGFTKAVVGEK